MKKTKKKKTIKKSDKKVTKKSPISAVDSIVMDDEIDQGNDGVVRDAVFFEKDNDTTVDSVSDAMEEELSKHEEDEKKDKEPDVVVSDDNKSKVEEKVEPTTRQLRDFVPGRDKFKEIKKGNFRQRAEEAGIKPEDVKDFKYWLRDNPDSEE